MAKITIKNLSVDSFNYMGAMIIDRHSGKSATFIETSDGNDRFTFYGKGLTYTADDDIVAGTITKIVFQNSLGDVLGTYDDLKIDPKKLPVYAAASKYEFFQFLTKGDDTIIGSNGTNYFRGGAGNDTIFGRGGNDDFYDGPGNDRMTGGAGKDYYHYSTPGGHDVITDFRGTGPEAERDRILTGPSFELRQVGKNVIVDFVDGSGTIKLLDVKLAQVQDDIIWV